MTGVVSSGPHFEDFARGQVFDSAPAVTITPGLLAAHQAIVGNRLRLALDQRRALAVTGVRSFVSPAVVWDLAIGQSTVATQNVRANLFYRGLALRGHVAVGQTLSTTTTVVALKQNRRRAGRPATGLVVLRIVTRDGDGLTVLDFWRCAMVLLRDPQVDTGFEDDLDVVGTSTSDAEYASSVAAWQITSQRAPAAPALTPGMSWSIDGGDVVSSAPELARLTLNLATVHHDARAAGGERLVYGGHAIGVALTQLARSLPDILTVVGWQSCDHTGPVHEGDTLRSSVSVERVVSRRDGGSFAHLRVVVTADGTSADEDRSVLDWRPVVLLPA